MNSTPYSAAVARLSVRRCTRPSTRSLEAQLPMRTNQTSFAPFKRTVTCCRRKPALKDLPDPEYCRG
jgi:hypothetical protein